MGMSISLPIHNFKIFAEKLVLNQLRPVQIKDWSKTTVFGFFQSSPVFFGSRMKADWSWSQSLTFGPKNWTGLDLQALMRVKNECKVTWRLKWSPFDKRLSRHYSFITVLHNFSEVFQEWTLFFSPEYFFSYCIIFLRSVQEYTIPSLQY